jgi:hypothetical protein
MVYSRVSKSWHYPCTVLGCIAKLQAMQTAVQPCNHLHYCQARSSELCLLLRGRLRHMCSCPDMR